MLDPQVLVFDIETVADSEGYRQLASLGDQLSEQEIATIMQHERLAESGTTFIRHHLHKVVAISLLLVSQQGLKLWSLGRGEESEQDILARFFQGIDKLSPTLVSWNGSGFDLPVLHYRALFHGISAARYFEIGDEDREFRYNNYLGRFHWRHIDMMDVLSGYQMRSVARLDEIAKLCGLPGKLDVDGGQVQEMWFAGEHEAICDYCETDVLNTYGVFLRFEQLRGRLHKTEYQRKVAELEAFLKTQEAPHLQAFMQAWQPLIAPSSE